MPDSREIISILALFALMNHLHYRLLRRSHREDRASTVVVAEETRR